MSNVTSICGTPRGAGGMPASWNLPSVRLSLRHRALALQHVHLDRGLVVGRGREDLALARRDGGVALDEAREHAAQRLDAERQRRHVEQQEVLHVARQHARLHGRADRHHLVRVHALVRLLAEELLHQLLDLRDARAAADQHHLVDVARARRPASFRHCRTGAIVRCSRSSTSCSNFARVSFSVEVLGAGGVGGDEGQVDLGLERRRQLLLGLLRRFLQPLQRHLVLARGRCPGPS